MSVEEKLGGVQRSQKQMDDFREVIHHCRFKDLRLLVLSLLGVICKSVKAECI